MTIVATPAAALDSGLARDAAELTQIVARSAPGCAGQAVDWPGSVGTAAGVGDVPELWRVGTAALRDMRQSSWPLAVPLLDHSHLQILSPAEARAHAETLVETLVLRAVTYFRPGLVRVHVWDHTRFGGSLPGLYPLTRGGLLTVHDPDDLAGLLGRLSDQIRRVQFHGLPHGHPTLASMAAQSGDRTEPWTLAVLLGDGEQLNGDDTLQLQRVMHDGLACGVCLVLVNVSITRSAPCEVIDLAARQTSMASKHVAATPDPPLNRELIISACSVIADAWESMRIRSGDLTDLLPEQWGLGSSRDGVTAPVGFSVDGQAREVLVHIGDGSPHVLNVGASGTGKTNFLYTLITSLAVRYPPRELQFMLLDFKEGVSFAQFAPGYRDETWLPHAALVGVNMNQDREFGLAMLRRLVGELSRRGDAARAYGATKLSELREHDPDGDWPRIVAVVDEFQFIFRERDAITREAIVLLDDIARRGRSFGVHLVFATQGLASIANLAGFKAIFEQFVLRIAMPRADEVLDDSREPAKGLPDWHAIVNHRGGVPHAHETLRVPHAPSAELVELQREMHARWAGAPPVVFDGNKAPDMLALTSSDAGPILGRFPDMGQTPVVVPLPDRPGRNIAVLGGEEARPVLDAAARSLAAQDPSARHILAPLAGKPLHLQVPHEVIDDASDFTEFIIKFAREVDDRGRPGGARSPIYLTIWGVDLAYPVLDGEGIKALRLVLHYGPALGVHVIGWWHSVGRLKSLLSSTAAVDDVGVLVALDIPGEEFGRFIESWSLAWTHRSGRALFYDRNGSVRHPEPFQTPKGS